MFSDTISAKNKTVGEILVIRVPRYTWPVAVYLKFSEDNISQRTMYSSIKDNDKLKWQLLR